MKNRSKKKVEKALKKKRRFVWTVLLFINAYLLLSFFFGEMGLFKSIKLQRTHSSIRQEIHFLRRENQDLTERIKALRNDPFYIERLARNRLGLVKEGELIYEFYEADAP
ncbi:MAG: septum formation initiator family protein [Nitrospiria bacterium]